MIVEVAFVKKPSVREQEAGAREVLVLPLQQVSADTVEQGIAMVAVENAKKLQEAGVDKLTPVTRKTTI